MPSNPAETSAKPEILPLPDRDALQRVHFIAVGGTGMGSLAGLLKARGIEVTGSDKALYPPMSDALASWKIPVVEGFDPKNLTGEPFGTERLPDLIVIGNAVRPDNPEAQAALDSGIPYRSFSDALFELAMENKHRIVVSGTHGKTTTTSLAAYLLLATGRDPSLLVGGEDVYRVDLPDLGVADAGPGPSPKLAEKDLPPAGAQLLGVVEREAQALGKGFGIENDRRRDHRPRPRATAGLVDPGDDPTGFPFQAEIGHDVI